MILAIDILPGAQKQLAQIDRHDHPRIISAIRSLADDPHPLGSRRLSGRPAWRMQIGQYRVIYEIHADRILVLVIKARRL